MKTYDMAFKRFVKSPFILVVVGWLGACLAGFATVSVESDRNGNLVQIKASGASFPTIITQPTNWLGLPGATAVFSVRTVTDATNTFQWKKNGVNIAGATSESLVLANVSTTDEAFYSVVVSNPKGSVTSASARLSLDSDGDGIADWQEKTIFGGLTQTGSGDFDSDGITNAEEIADGTDSKSRNSRFYRLSATAQNGSIRAVPESATGRYASGTKVVLTATPLAGYSFIEWTGQASGVVNTTTVTMSSDVTVAAVFGSTLGVALDAPDLVWMTDPAYPWLPMGLAGSGKVSSNVDEDWAESTPLTNLSQSWVAAYVEGPATVSFRWMQSTTSATATLKCYVDANVATTTTADNVWRQTSISVGNGLHLVRWLLDRPAGTGTDVAKLDEVIVSTSASVSLAQAVDAGELPWATYRMNPWFGTSQGSHDGADTASCVLTGQFQETWIETRVTGPGLLTFWYRSSGANAFTVQLDGGTAVSLSSGWTKYTLPVTTAGTHIVRWSANTNNMGYSYQVSASVWLDEVTWLPNYVATPAAPITINAALDNTTQVFTTGGSKPWVVTTQNLRDSVDALQAGTIANASDSWIETKVNGPVRVYFYWRVDCDATDKLQVLVNGVERSFISGTTAWAQSFVDITTQGVHTVRWRYVKDAATAAALDSAWLDGVSTSGLGTSTPVAGTLTTPLADAVDKTTLGVRTGGNASWTLDATTSHDGVDAARSGAITHGQESWMETAVTGAGKMTFWWKASTEETFDYLAVLIDGVEQARISGVQDWQQKTFTIAGANTHVIRWRYVKDANLNSGSDAAWVDQVTWTGTLPASTSSVSPLVLNVGPQAGSYSIYITEAGAWTTAEALPWATISSPGGTGNATISVSVLAQTSGKKLSGLLTISGWTVALNQDGYTPPEITAPIVEAIIGTGVPYSLSGFTGRNFPQIWQATGLPTGLTIDPTTGLIAGTPTKAGRFIASISAKNPGGTSRPATIVFVVRGPTLSPFTGTYAGIISSTGPLAEGLGGFISFNATSATAASGSLNLGTKKYPFTGTIIPNIAGNQRLTTSILRTGTTPLTLVVDFDSSRWVGRATGTVTGDGEVLEFTTWKNLWSASTNPAGAFAGYYTSALFPGSSAISFPQGVGHIEWTISTAGVAAIIGKAADGTVLTGSSILWPDGQIPFYQQLYKATGSILGTALINMDSSVSGRLDWAKKVQAASVRDYQSGFAATPLTIQGGLWIPPPTGQIVLGLTDAADNAQIVFANGGIDTASQFVDTDQIFRISKTNVAAFSTSLIVNPAGVKLSINAAKGTFTGSFTLNDGGVKRPVAFDGVMLSSVARGYGWFMLPELPLGAPANSKINSGRVTLQPYP